MPAWPSVLPTPQWQGLSFTQLTVNNRNSNTQGSARVYYKHTKNDSIYNLQFIFIPKEFQYFSGWFRQDAENGLLEITSMPLMLDTGYGTATGRIYGMYKADLLPNSDYLVTLQFRCPDRGTITESALDTRLADTSLYVRS